MVIPLEQEISKAAASTSRFQHDYGSLAEKLSGLGLAGSDRIRTLNQDIADVLFTDASDARSVWAPRRRPFTTTSSGRSK
jgi:hypothetical protein